MADGGYIRIEEVAERWAVSTATVRRMLREGALGGIKIGKAWRVGVADMLAYEQQNTVAPKAYTTPRPKAATVAKAVITQIV